MAGAFDIVVRIVTMGFEWLLMLVWEWMETGGGWRGLYSNFHHLSIAVEFPWRLSIVLECLSIDSFLECGGSRDNPPYLSIDDEPSHRIYR